jgi:hypothetical protein
MDPLDYLCERRRRDLRSKTQGAPPLRGLRLAAPLWERVVSLAGRARRPLPHAGGNAILVAERIGPAFWGPRCVARRRSEDSHSGLGALNIRGLNAALRAGR